MEKLFCCLRGKNGNKEARKKAVVHNQEKPGSLDQVAVVERMSKFWIHKDCGLNQYA